jgi:hypothetical protein
MLQLVLQEPEPCANYIVSYKGLGGRSAFYTHKISFVKMCFGVQVGEVQLDFVMTHIWLQIPLLHKDEYLLCIVYWICWLNAKVQ